MGTRRASLNNGSKLYKWERSLQTRIQSSCSHGKTSLALRWETLLPFTPCWLLMLVFLIHMLQAGLENTNCGNCSKAQFIIPGNRCQWGRNLLKEKGRSDLKDRGVEKQNNLRDWNRLPIWTQRQGRHCSGLCHGAWYLLLPLGTCTFYRV